MKRRMLLNSIWNSIETIHEKARAKLIAKRKLHYLEIIQVDVLAKKESNLPNDNSKFYVPSN